MSTQKTVAGDASVKKITELQKYLKKEVTDYDAAFDSEKALIKYASRNGANMSLAAYGFQNDKYGAFMDGTRTAGDKEQLLANKKNFTEKQIKPLTRNMKGANWWYWDAMKKDNASYRFYSDKDAVKSDDPGVQFIEKYADPAAKKDLREAAGYYDQSYQKKQVFTNARDYQERMDDFRKALEAAYQSAYDNASKSQHKKYTLTYKQSWKEGAPTVGFVHVKEPDAKSEAKAKADFEKEQKKNEKLWERDFSLKDQKCTDINYDAIFAYEQALSEGLLWRRGCAVVGFIENVPPEQQTEEIVAGAYNDMVTAIQKRVAKLKSYVLIPSDKNGKTIWKASNGASSYITNITGYKTTRVGGGNKLSWITREDGRSQRAGANYSRYDVDYNEAVQIIIQQEMKKFKDTLQLTQIVLDPDTHQLKVVSGDKKGAQFKDNGLTTAQKNNIKNLQKVADLKIDYKTANQASSQYQSKFDSVAGILRGGR